MKSSGKSGADLSKNFNDLDTVFVQSDLCTAFLLNKLCSSSG